MEAPEECPARPISELAAALGVSQGHLDREFTRIVGLTPRMLARVLRVRRLLESVDVQEPVGWSRLAAELGWYDQAHLVRDVTPLHRRPAVGVRRRAAALPSARRVGAGFVPEPGR